jgi:hypothetical protein
MQAMIREADMSVNKLSASHLGRAANALVIVMASLVQMSAPSFAGEPARLPDTETTRAGAYSAWLVEPTTRYSHGVLGDAIEAGGFVVERGGKRFVFRLGPEAVFEDRRVRLADLDGDGIPEAIVVKAYLARGAAIAVYRVGRDGIEPLAESTPIGTPNRWLNPVGVGALAARGQMAIAAVVTPHLAGSLRLYRLSGTELIETARIDGYTNHIIGKRDLDLGHLADIDADGLADVVLPTLDRLGLAAVSFAGGHPRELRRWPVAARIESLKPDGTGGFAVTTSAGVFSIGPKVR